MVDAAKNIEVIPLDDFDLSCQTRTKLNAAAVRDYRAIVVNGEDLDPGIAYRTDDGQVLLSAGFHRLAAYRKAGRDSMPVEIRSGTSKEARFWAIKGGIADNLKHVGVRLTAADRRKTVEMLLGEKPEYGDSVIAKMAEVHSDTVARCRSRLEKAATIRNAGSRVGLDGKIRDVSRIGRKAGVDARKETAKRRTAPKDPAKEPVEPSTSTGKPDAEFESLGAQASMPPSLEDRLKTLNEEARAKYKKFLDIRLGRGEPEDTASWRALVDVRQELGQLKAENLLQEDQEESPDSAPCVEENCATTDTEQSIGMFEQIDELLVQAIALADDLRAIQKAGCNSFTKDVEGARSALRAWRETRADAGERAAG